MASTLTSELCGWPEERVFVFADAPNLTELNMEIAQRFEPVHDVALFYYVGHGQPDDEDQLCMYLPGTMPKSNLRQVTSLGFREVRKALNYSQAKTKIVILDCCFSGLATWPERALAATDMLSMTAGTGAIVMAASNAYNTAWFEPDSHQEPHTYFTRYLAETIESGIPGKPSFLTLGHIFADLSERLRRDSLPSPTSNVRDRAGDFIFARNVAPNRTIAPTQDAAAVRMLLADVEEQTLKMLVERAEAATRDLEAFKAGQQQRAADHAMLQQLDTANASLPLECRLLDLLDLQTPTAEAVEARWAQQGTTPAAAVIGVCHDGPFAIDLTMDGPNGLIAGTTGSGKSELLQSIVASLAVANSPETMTFVLVDYKGGEAFMECAFLPHTVGMVTDLDDHLVKRALQSLAAELKRREQLLADAGAKDIEDYSYITVTETRRLVESSLAGGERASIRPVPLPHLVIVIDEFASMVHELPDFVHGLVDIAQRGRSLGIHLLLATQRPSGVVSPEIRANTNLRIALRVSDGAESSDVIKTPDAAFISRNMPGRAYARLSLGPLAAFQAGRVRSVRSLPTTAPRPPSSARNPQTSDLRLLVDAIQGANTALGIPQQHTPWLPPLPNSVVIDQVPPVRRSAHDLAPVPFGMVDLPALQDRRAAVLDFARLGHMLIGGAPRSGRSQILRTMAGVIAMTQSTQDVHIYGIDFGAGALLPLTALPHCGAVVPRAQTERAIRLITRLNQEITNRQELLSARGFTGVVEQRLSVPANERLPHIVVFLDRWDGFLGSLGELDGGAMVDQIYKILREGQDAGVHMIITGDRQVLSGRIAALTDDKLSFQLPDKQDFSLIGINPRKIPDEIPPGRAFRGESMLETQIALLTSDSSGQGQAAAITAIGEAAEERDAVIARSRRPFRVDVLPSRLTFAQAWELRDEAAGGRPLWAMVGVGGNELIGSGPDLLDGVPSFIIAGPPRSGRSTLLQAMARSILTQGSSVILVAPRTNSPLRAMAGMPGVLASFDQAAVTSQEIEEALSKAPGPVAVLIDDAEMLKDSPAAQAFKDIINFGADKGRGLILAGAAEDLSLGFSGWHVDARKARRGALLSPQGTMDGDLIGTRLARSMVGGQVHPGRALLHLGDGKVRSVQVPVG
jgi:S-DNA-T family DNA segregation ATPase FtsK/SpoIIIE